MAAKVVRAGRSRKVGPNILKTKKTHLQRVAKNQQKSPPDISVQPFHDFYSPGGVQKIRGEKGLPGDSIYYVPS